MFSHLSNLKKASLFFGLVMALTLAVVLILRLIMPQSDMVTLAHMLMPLLATLIMLFVLTRDGYSGNLRSSLGLARSGRKVWIMAMLLPLLILAVSFGLAWVSGGADFVAPTASDGLPTFLVDILISFLINILFAGIFIISEEIGFRGYLLPRLQELGYTRALLLSGFLHGVWHLPLILLTSLFLPEGNRWLTVPVFLLLLTAAGVIYGKLRLATDSIWPVVIMHTCFNIFPGVFIALTNMNSPLAFYLVGESGMFTLVATVIAAYFIMQRWPAPDKTIKEPGLADKSEPMSPVDPPLPAKV